jgi:hypothetical protein
MKISTDGSSFSTSGDVDSTSETISQNNDSPGVQRASDNETSFQEQRIVKLEEIAARFSEDRTGKESELARCVVELVQANERLTAQVYNLSLQFVAHHGTLDLTSNETNASLTTQVKNLQDSLQMASEERDELKQSAIASQQEKSDLFVRLSNLVKEECAQLKSELSDVKKDCVSSIAGLKTEVALPTTQGHMVHPVKQYVWESSRDVSVNGIRLLELLECPPMTSGVHKWSVFVEEYTSGTSGFLVLGVASIVHSLDKKRSLGCQAGGWGYFSDGVAFHNGACVKENLPQFQKGSKVTFILDLTGEGTLSASVDEKSFQKLFSDMLSKVRTVNPEGGFTPAVRLHNSDNRVRFLGFERVSA